MVPSVGYGTLSRMGLLSKTRKPSTGPTFHSNPHKVTSTTLKSMMMSLLHNLVGKVTKFLKNQKQIITNQKLLATCYNEDHPNKKLQLGFASCSNEDKVP